MRYWVFTADLCLRLLYFTGLLLALSDVRAYIAGRLTLRRRLPISRRVKDGMLISKLSSLVYISTGKVDMGRKMVYICLTLFAVSFAYSLKIFSFFFSLIIALLTASAPIVSLVSKIQNQRSRSSKEGLAFTGELCRSYIIENKNIYSALERTAKQSLYFPICGRQAYLLLLRLRSAEGLSDEKRACSDFAAALGSRWGRSVSLALMSACSGYDISEALTEIIRRLKGSETGFQEKKRMLYSQEQHNQKIKEVILQ